MPCSAEHAHAHVWRAAATLYTLGGIRRRWAAHLKEYTMCRPVTCPTCGKTTWAGCGQHIDAVRATVSADQWCTCPRPDAPADGGSAGSGSGFLARLLGGRA